jgi:two-component system response regulator CpxR
MGNYRLLLIDDDKALSDLLTEYLETYQFDITPALDGQVGLEIATREHFDLILLDVMLPKLDGFEVLKRLRLTHKTPVMMLTARGDDFDRILGLELGADDYLPKPFNHRELLARINATLRRVTFQSEVAQSPVIELSGVKLNVNNRQIICEGQWLETIGTEFEILKLLMTQGGEIVSKEQLSEQVLGRRLTTYDRSIDMHVSNIRKKLERISPDEKIKTVRGAGYLFLKGAE